MKKSFVILTALKGVIFTQRFNADGSPKLDKNGNPFGHIRVENPGTIDLAYAYNNGGVKRGNSALINMTLEAWNKAKSAYVEGMEIQGRVRVIETTDAELAKTKGLKPKMAGSNEDAQPCLLGGAQIFRGTEFDATGELEDILVKHDNVIEGSSVKKTQESLNG